METNINSCIKDWDLFHEFNDTKIVFVTEIEYPRFKRRITKKQRRIEIKIIRMSEVI